MQSRSGHGHRGQIVDEGYLSQDKMKVCLTALADARICRKKLAQGIVATKLTLVIAKRKEYSVLTLATLTQGTETTAFNTDAAVIATVPPFLSSYATQTTNFINDVSTLQTNWPSGTNPGPGDSYVAAVGELCASSMRPIPNPQSPHHTLALPGQPRCLYRLSTSDHIKAHRVGRHVTYISALS